MAKSIVSVEWLNENLENSDLIILDASQENNKSNLSTKFKNTKITGARYFDIKNAFSDTKSKYPNTLPKPLDFEIEFKVIKFMDFHKSTLEELRKKDNDNRQYSTELTREVISLNKKIQEEKRNTTCSQTESTYLKRQIEDYDQVQQECKRIRRENMEKCVQKSRCDSDILNMKVRLEEVSTERDSLRKQNMQLENRVAILETSSQLENCRKSISR